MTMNCSKCHSDQTQAIKAILQAGTTFTSGTVTGAMIGSSAGILTGTTHGQNQTALAARFSPPKKPSKMEIIGGGVLSAAVSPFLFAGLPYVVFPLAIGSWWVWEASRYVKRNAIYNEQYPLWKQMVERGVYCHRCGNVDLQ